MRNVRDVVVKKHKHVEKIEKKSVHKEEKGNSIHNENLVAMYFVLPCIKNCVNVFMKFLGINC